MKKIIMAVGAALAAACLLGSCSIGAKTEYINPEEIRFIQFDSPTKGEDIAIMQTSMGTIKFRFFPEQAPKAVENFTTLAKEGFYDGQKVMTIKTNRAFLAGDATGDGKGAKSIYGAPFKNEYSKDLWHFPGAVSSISNKEGYGDSRFYMIGNSEVPQEVMQQMQKNAFPPNVIERYEQNGGTPELDRGCTIFGQIFEGLDVVNKISASEYDDKARPLEDIIIEKVTITKYGEE